MRKVKILAIAPYKGMSELISSLAEEREDIELTSCVGDLHEGLRIARERSYHNYDVIISRGGTADLIRNELEIPVVDAPLSAYDMLRSIKMGENYSGKFAVAGFKSITNCARMLCDLLQLQIDIFTFQSSEQVRPILSSLKEQAYDLVICDMIGSSTARDLGLNSILVPSGVESLGEALDEAVALFTTANYINRQKDIFQKTLTQGDEDIIIYDSRNNIWFTSLTNSAQHSQILNMAHTYLPAFTKTDGQLFERPMDDYLLSISNQHIYYEEEQYTLLRILKKKMLFTENDNSISIYNKNQEYSNNSSASYNSANYVGRTRELLDDYSKTAFPVLIMGEVGTGKDKAAALIYENGPYQNAPYYVIDCELLNERKWKALIDSENSLLGNLHTTIFIKNIGKLNNTQFSRFTVYMEQTELTKRNRLIFSIVSNGEDESIIQSYLANQLSCLILKLPPLRDRTEDIPSIATLYINQLNAAIGKQIVGFEPDAMELMKSYQWPHNLDQLKRIIKELVTVTMTSYITADNVRYFLDSEMPAEQKMLSDDGMIRVDPRQTLDEITYGIIRNILSETKMSKEKAANRLGISRSTLWRILKTHDNDKND
ncbi:MAG: PrpR N-terminal domain-containing protein [Lachnospiraceae bacterium]